MCAELVQAFDAEKKFSEFRGAVYERSSLSGQSATPVWYCAEVEGPVLCLACLQASSGNDS